MATMRLTAGLLFATLCTFADEGISAPLSGATMSYAEVRRVTPVTRVLRASRQVCRDTQVEYVTSSPYQRYGLGTLLGSVFGGLLGNQIGHDSGRVVATVAGAATGAYAGNRIQNAMMPDNVFTNIERSCATVAETVEELVGYDVYYRIGTAQEAVVRTNYDPGNRIPLRDGKLLLDGKTRQTK